VAFDEPHPPPESVPTILSTSGHESVPTRLSTSGHESVPTRLSTSGHERHKAKSCIVSKGKGKSKGHPITGQEGPEEE
jgi:hypothetical protein